MGSKRIYLDGESGYGVLDETIPVDSGEVVEFTFRSVDTTDDNDYHWLLSNDDASDGFLTKYNGNLHYYIRCAGSYEAVYSAASTIADSDDIYDGEEHIIHLERSSTGEWELTVDGVFVGDTVSISDDFDITMMGRNGTSGTEYFDGELSDITLVDNTYPMLADPINCTAFDDTDDYIATGVYPDADTILKVRLRVYANETSDSWLFGCNDMTNDRRFYFGTSSTSDDYWICGIGDTAYGSFTSVEDGWHTVEFGNLSLKVDGVEIISAASSAFFGTSSREALIGAMTNDDGSIGWFSGVQIAWWEIDGGGKVYPDSSDPTKMTNARTGEEFGNDGTGDLTQGYSVADTSGDENYLTFLGGDSVCVGTWEWVGPFADIERTYYTQGGYTYELNRTCSRRRTIVGYPMQAEINKQIGETPASVSAWNRGVESTMNPFYSASTTVPCQEESFTPIEGTDIFTQLQTWVSGHSESA